MVSVKMTMASSEKKNNSTNCVWTKISSKNKTTTTKKRQVRYHHKWIELYDAISHELTWIGREISKLNEN